MLDRTRCLSESLRSPREQWEITTILGIPEIVEDICSSAARPRGTSLRQRYVASTRPCIVQFKTPEPDPRWVESSLYYLYSGVRGLPMSLDANTCWTAKDMS